MTEQGCEIGGERFIRTFAITFAEYWDFNWFQACRMLAEKIHKNRIWGIVELVMAAAAAGAIVGGWVPLSPLSFVAVMMLLFLGLYSLVYYQLVFPAVLKKAVRKQYDSREMFKENLTVAFCEAGFREENAERTVQIPYAEVGELFLGRRITVLITQKGRATILPAGQMDPDVMRFIRLKLPPQAAGNQKAAEKIQ